MKDYEPGPVVCMIVQAMVVLYDSIKKHAVLLVCGGWTTFTAPCVALGIKPIVGLSIFKIKI